MAIFSKKANRDARSNLRLRDGLMISAAMCAALGLGVSFLPNGALAQAANAVLQFSQPTQGSLAQGDGQLNSGEFRDVYSLNVVAGQRVDITMESRAFDPYLLVRGPGDLAIDNDDDADGRLGTGAHIIATAPAAGVMTVTATSFQAGETGAYVLRANSVGGAATAPNDGGKPPTPAPAPPPPPVASGPAPIRIGTPSIGRLAQGDGQLSSGEFRDIYAINVTAGQQLDIAMNSADFDSYVLVRGPGDFAADNDDDENGNGSRNSRLRVTAPAAGQMLITATSFQPGESGNYQLSVSPVSASRPNNGGPNGNNGRPAPAAGQLQSGRPATGALAQGDRTLGTSGEFYDDYTFTAQAGQQITLSMESSAFDTYLLIGGPNNFRQDNDDAAQGSTNAGLTFRAPTTGTYQVRATSFQRGEVGPYRLSMTTGSAGTGPRPNPNNGGNNNGNGIAQNGAGLPQLVAGRNTDGILAPNGNARGVVRYAIAGARGQRIALGVTGGFDTVLTLISPSGAREQNDDARQGTTDSFLDTTFAENGTYIVEVSGFQPDARGNFRVSVGGGDRGQGSRPPGQTGPSPSAGGPGTITMGQTAQGELRQGDTTLQSGEFIDNFSFQGRRGQPVQIDVASTAFDTYLLLTPPTGQQQDNDDGPDGTNSQLVFTPTADGVYRIGVTSFQPGETGRYSVRVGAPPPQTANSGGGNAAQGKVFGVFVGISDYPGSANDLSNTDKDAQDLARELSRAGLLASQSVVLTNGQATRAAVAAAIRQVAGQAGPNDTFVFFYSGHGSQMNNTPTAAAEPDRKDEAIVLYDGMMVDDEMGQLFAGSHAGVSMIVLDSCFSGGFARDVVNRPGVMGLFSSEEDLTSQVADKFEAGGYLSYFIRSGLGRAGDLDGNHSITAGELSTYLRNSFAHEGQIGAETMDRQRNYQYLVVDRGGVKVDDVVLVLR